MKRIPFLFGRKIVNDSYEGDEEEDNGSNEGKMRRMSSFTETGGSTDGNTNSLSLSSTVVIINLDDSNDSRGDDLPTHETMTSSLDNMMDSHEAPTSMIMSD
jgi:hypothetical protein